MNINFNEKTIGLAVSGVLTAATIGMGIKKHVDKQNNIEININSQDKIDVTNAEIILYVVESMCKKYDVDITDMKKMAIVGYFMTWAAKHNKRLMPVPNVVGQIKAICKKSNGSLKKIKFEKNFVENNQI